MQLSSLDKAQIDDLIELLPVDYEKSARDSKAFLRRRNIKNPAELMHAVLLYCGLDQSLREVAGNFTLLGERISDSAVHERLKACGDWLKMLVEQLWFKGLSKLSSNLRLIVIDGSSLSVPGADGTSYRLHIAIDLVRLDIIHIEVTNKHVGESLMHYPLREGDIVMVDRFYNLPDQIIGVSDMGTLITVRLNPNSMRLVTVGGKEKFVVHKALNDAQSDQVCLPVWIANNKGQYVEAWVHAQRLPEELRAEARRQCRANSKSKNIKQETLLYAEWTMILTTVPPAVLDTKTVMAFYRVRWQVELFIKRLKSLLHIDKLRCFDDESKLNRMWIYGKLLFATLLMKRVEKKFKVGGLEPDVERVVTPWRFWKVESSEMKAIVMAIGSRKVQRQSEAKKMMAERPRKRQLQSLPQRIKNLVVQFGQTAAIC